MTTRSLRLRGSKTDQREKRKTAKKAILSLRPQLRKSFCVDETQEWLDWGESPWFCVPGVCQKEGDQS